LSGSSLQFLLAQTGVALNRAKWTKPIEGAQWFAEHVDDACERALLQQWLDGPTAPTFCGSDDREAPRGQLITTRGNFVTACILELVVQEQDSLELDRIRPTSMFEVVCALHDDMNNNVRQHGVEIESTKFTAFTRAFFDVPLGVWSEYKHGFRYKWLVVERQ
jgi:hypothetical protein